MLLAWALAVKVTGLRGLGWDQKRRIEARSSLRDATSHTWISVGLRPQDRSHP